MKLRLFYRKNWGPALEVIGHEDGSRNRYGFYVGGMLWMELRGLDICQRFLDAMNEAERMGGDTEIQFNDKAWGMDVRPTTVHIWSTLEDEWQDDFSHREVRLAVEGWMKLLQMPDSEESEVIVDLGDQ